MDYGVCGGMSQNSIFPLGIYLCNLTIPNRSLGTSKAGKQQSSLIGKTFTVCLLSLHMAPQVCGYIHLISTSQWAPSLPFHSRRTLTREMEQPVPSYRAEGRHMFRPVSTLTVFSLFYNIAPLH